MESGRKTDDERKTRLMEEGKWNKRKMENRRRIEGER